MTIMRLPSEATLPYYSNGDDQGFIRITDLDDQAVDTYLSCKKQLAGLQRRNTNLLARYEDSHKVEHLDIAIPPHLTDLAVAGGMTATGIDVLAEKLRMDGYKSAGGDMLGLDDAAIQARINLELERAQHEGLITGVGFVSVGAGNPDRYEPEVVITSESPLHATAIFDRKQGRYTKGYARHVNRNGSVDMETIYELDRNIYLERNAGGEMVVVDVDEHMANHLFLRPLVNRGRSSRLMGTTDITPSCMYIADAVVRTLLGMEINREFYTTPQRWLMGADMSMFKDKDGKQVSTWQAVAGLMLAAPAPVMEDDDGELVYGAAPKVGQFTAAPPTPYIEQNRDYKLAFASEMGFPAGYLGYMAGENPASADAIRALAQRLTDTSLARQRGFTYDQRDVVLAMLLVRDGRPAITPAVLTEVRKIEPNYPDPRPDTQAADTDAVVKLVGLGMLQPDSVIAMRRAGLSEQEILVALNEARAARANQRAAARAAMLAGQGAPGQPPAADTPPVVPALPPATV